MKVEIDLYHHNKACVFTDEEAEADEHGVIEAGSYPRLIQKDSWESVSDDGIHAAQFECPKCHTVIVLDMTAE